MGRRTAIAAAGVVMLAGCQSLGFLTPESPPTPAIPIPAPESLDMADGGLPLPPIIGRLQESNGRPYVGVVLDLFLVNRRKLLTLGVDGVVRRWDLSTGKEGGWVSPGDSDRPKWVVEHGPGFQPQAHVTLENAPLQGFEWDSAYGESEGRIRIDRMTDYLKTYTAHRSIVGAHVGRISALCRVPGSDILASAGRDGAVRFWNLESLKAVAGILRRGIPVTAMKAAESGRVLWVGRADGSITAYDIGGLRHFESGR